MKTLEVVPLNTTLLVMLRLSSLFLLTPLTPVRQLPINVRLLLLLSLSIPLVFGLNLSCDCNNTLSLLGGAVAEVLNGLFLSLTVFALFGAYQLAGQLMDNQMGLNATSVLNPQANSQEPVMGNFLSLIAVAIFFASGGHRYLFQGLAYSLIQLPPGQLILTAGLQLALTQFSLLFSHGLVIAAPIVFCLLLIDIISGLATRNMPQVSIYFVTLPLKIILGLFLSFSCLNYYQPWMNSLSQAILNHWQSLLS